MPDASAWQILHHVGGNVHLIGDLEEGAVWTVRHSARLLAAVEGAPIRHLCAPRMKML